MQFPRLHKETSIFRESNTIGDEVERLEEDVTNAAKTATTYITDVTGGGVMVHPSGDSTSGWKIASAIELLRSGVSYIKAWLDDTVAKVRIGLESAGHIVIDNDSVDVMKGTVEVASFGQVSIIGMEDATHVEISSDEMAVRVGSQNYVSMGPAYWNDGLPSGGGVIAFTDRDENYIMLEPSYWGEGEENEGEVASYAMTMSSAGGISLFSHDMNADEADAGDCILAQLDLNWDDLSPLKLSVVRQTSSESAEYAELLSVDQDGFLHSNGLYSENPDVTVGDTAPSSAQSLGEIRSFDASGNMIFYTQSVLTTGNDLYRSFVVRRNVSGTEVNNGFYLHIAADGTRSVTFTTGGGQAWRKALGLGDTTGAVPIANGGTGQTATTTTTVTIGAGATSIGYNVVHKWGKVVTIQLVDVALAAAVANGAYSGTLATIPSGYRPVGATAYGSPATPSGNMGGSYVRITTAGVITLRNQSGASIAAGTNVAFTATYVIT